MKKIVCAFCSFCCMIGWNACFFLVFLTIRDIFFPSVVLRFLLICQLLHWVVKRMNKREIERERFGDGFFRVHTHSYSHSIKLKATEKNLYQTIENIFVKSCIIFVYCNSTGFSCWMHACLVICQNSSKSYRLFRCHSICYVYALKYCFQWFHVLYTLMKNDDPNGISLAEKLVLSTYSTHIVMHHTIPHRIEFYKIVCTHNRQNIFLTHSLHTSTERMLLVGCHSAVRLQIELNRVQCLLYANEMKSWIGCCSANWLD